MSKNEKDYSVVVIFFAGVVFSMAILFFVGITLLMNGYSVISEKSLAEDYAHLPTFDEYLESVAVELDDGVTLTEDDHMRGNSDAPITIVEYSDYECPYCAQLHPDLKQLLEDYPDKVNWVFRHFPLDTHASAQLLAETSECIAEQVDEAFWTFTDIAFLNQNYTTEDQVVELTNNMDLDGEAVRTCLQEETYAAVVADDLASGKAVGVNATPGLVFMWPDGSQHLISGAVPYDVLAALIEINQ